MAHLLERTICIGLSYLLNIVLAIYDKEGVFLSDLVSVSCECVFLSDLVLMLLLSIEMQRTMIMA